MSTQVSSVKSVVFSLDKSNPPILDVSASGSVSSSGWKNGTLVPRVYVMPPQDGIQDFDFLATAPEGIVLWVISAISGDGAIQLESWMHGIRVHSSTNSVSVLLNQAASAVGRGKLTDHFITNNFISDPSEGAGHGGDPGALQGGDRCHK